METLTYSEIRYKLASIIRPIIENTTFKQIYESTAPKYSEDEMIELTLNRKKDTLDFLHDVCNALSKSTSEIKSLMSKTDPEVICCFYYRYWVLINILKEGSNSATNQMVFYSDDKEMFLKILLFGLAEGTSVV